MFFYIFAYIGSNIYTVGVLIRGIDFPRVQASYELNGSLRQEGMSIDRQIHIDR